MNLKRALAALLATAAAVTAVCCDDDSALLAALGSGCLLNSDCDPGLVCVYQRCHIECTTNEDCPLTETGERLNCVVGERPENVCQLGDEKDCDYNSQCPGEQRCGPDGRCRDECVDDRDCVDGQICLPQAVCADPAELNENGELEQRDPPDDQETGFPCGYDSQCVDVGPEGAPTFVCRDGSCSYECYDNVDCDPTLVCTPDDGDRTTPGKCTLPGGEGVNCVPGLQVACDCSGGGQGVQICNETGDAFGVCQRENGDSCAPP
jgi:hypothetical protein